jgi:biopolymer transport protein ExbD
MAFSGPGKSHHHDDEEYAPTIFSEINITPLTDIFLVLLIIFMVGSSIVVEQAQGGGTGVRVDLPKGAAKELHAAPRDFPIAILKDGTTVIEGKSIDIPSLTERLRALVKDAPDAQVIIQADTGVTHGRVVEVMEAAKSVGVERLAIATEAQ